MKTCFYFNPRSPCGERQYAPQLRGAIERISIHAPRAGSDTPTPTQGAPWDAISIHAPRAGSDYGVAVADVYADIFQSTLPVRGATRVLLRAGAYGDISIHAPRAGSDLIFPFFVFVFLIIFQSTLPVRGATRQPGDYFILSSNFNPRSPCGERRGVFQPAVVAP